MARRASQLVLSAVEKRGMKSTAVIPQYSRRYII
jgi:hypothetical protein